MEETRVENQKEEASKPVLDVDHLSISDPIREKASKLSREERARLEGVARALIGTNGHQAGTLVAR